MRCRHYIRRHASPRASYTAQQLALRYDFPKGLDGSGQVIGIIELGGGYGPSDYPAGLDITAVSVAGGANNPGDPSGADGEVQLDIQVAAAIAPKAKFRVYFAPNTDAGFLAAVKQAAAECGIVSISWGMPESQWDAATMQAFDAAFAAAPSVSFFVAAGDNGSKDGTPADSADFPASSPHVTGCGGTTITPTGETVWNDGTQGGATGGGYSTAFMRPSWQTGNTALQRGVPDVAGDADPASGYLVTIDGTPQVIGGTSAVAPLWAGLCALLNQGLGKRLGLLNPLLYALSPASGAFTDITVGNNGDYSAGPGWDACTGLGVPDGAKLLAALKGGGPPPPPPTGGVVTLAQAEAAIDTLPAFYDWRRNVYVNRASALSALASLWVSASHRVFGPGE